jgi:hypothetical protein
MKSYNRRDFTRHLGLTALFSPFLSLLESQPAQAAAGKAKYLFIFFTSGTEPAVWSPKGSSATSINFSPMTEPLAAIKDNLVIVEQLNSNGTASGHGSPGGLTGLNWNAPMISLEQFVSDKLRAAGIKTQVPNLILGGVPAEQQTTFYRESRALSPIASPSAAYQAVFGGGTPSPTPTDGMPAVDDRLRRRKSVLDVMKNELTQLSKTLGKFESEKLEVHTDSIRQLEERLAQQAEGSMGGGVVPVANCMAGANPGAGADPLASSVLHMDVAINAFACDITRVAAVQFGHHQSTQVSLPEVGDPGDWHNGFLHSDNPRTRLVKLEQWLSKQFVAAATKLKALPAPDGSGTLFDQTLMIWARDMGDAVAHDGTDMRFVFSGGAGGYLQKSAGGRYVAGGGKPHLCALLNAAEAMGITDFTGFGDAAASSRMPLADVGSG